MKMTERTGKTVLVAASAALLSVFSSLAASTACSLVRTVSVGEGIGREILLGQIGGSDVTRPVSASSGNGVVTSDKPLNTTYWYYASGSGYCYPEKAFDNGTDYSNSKTRALADWSNADGVVNIVYTFTNGLAYAIGKYNLAVVTAARSPNSWTLYGSNDYDPSNDSPSTTGNDMSSATWTVIDTREGVAASQWSNAGSKSFTSNGDSETAYKSIRIEVTACNATDGWLNIAEMEFFTYEKRYCTADFTKPVSETSGNGVVTTDKPLSTTYWYYHDSFGYSYPEKVFDNGAVSSYSNRALADWSQAGGELNIVYTLTNGTAFAVGGYRISGHRNYSREPKAWKIYGSNDYDPTNESPSTTGNDMSSATWTEIDSRSGETSWGADATRYYLCNGDYTNSYTSFRIQVTDCAVSDWVTISEMEYYAFCEGGDIDFAEGGLRDIAVDGTVTMSPFNTMSGAWYRDENGLNVFDDDADTRAITPMTTPANLKGVFDIVYTFAKPQVVNAYRIMPEIKSEYIDSRTPKAWTILGSNDYDTKDCGVFTNATWHVIDKRTSVSGWSTSEARAFVATNSVPYKTVRIRFDSNQNSGSDYDYSTIYEMEYFQAPALSIIGVDGATNNVFAFSSAYPALFSADEFTSAYTPGQVVEFSGVPTDANITATCTGYTLETFDPEAGTWATTASGNDTSISLSVGRKIQRLTWLYADGATFNISATTSGEGSLDKTSETVAKGGTVSFTATPADSSQYVSWSGDIEGAAYSSDNRTITLPADRVRSVIATFASALVFTEDATFTDASGIGQLPITVSGGMLTLGGDLAWSSELSPLGSTETPITITSGGSVDINNNSTFANNIDRAFLSHEKMWVIAGDGSDGNGAIQNNNARNYYLLGKVRLAGDASIGGTQKIDITPHKMSKLAPDRATIDQVDGADATLTIKTPTLKTSYADIDLYGINVESNVEFSVCGYSRVKTDVANGGKITLTDGSTLLLANADAQTLAETAVYVSDGTAQTRGSDYLYGSCVTNNFAAPITMGEGASLAQTSGVLSYEGGISGTLNVNGSVATALVNSAVTGSINVSSGTAELNSIVSDGVTQSGGMLHLGESFAGAVTSSGGTLNLDGTLSESSSITKSGGDLYIYEGFDGDVTSTSAANVYFMGSAKGSLTQSGASGGSAHVNNFSDIPYINLEDFANGGQFTHLYTKPYTGSSMYINGLNYDCSNTSFVILGLQSPVGTTCTVISNSTINCTRLLLGAKNEPYGSLRIADGTTITVSDEMRMAYNTAASGSILEIAEGGKLVVENIFVVANSGSSSFTATNSVVINGGTLEATSGNIGNGDFVIVNNNDGNGSLILNSGYLNLGGFTVTIRNVTRNDNYITKSSIPQRFEINGGTFNYGGGVIRNMGGRTHGEADVVFAGGTMNATGDFTMSGHLPVLFRNKAADVSTVARVSNDEAFTLNLNGNTATFTTALHGDGNVVLAGAGTFAGQSEVQGVLGGDWTIDAGTTADLRGAASLLGNLAIGEGSTVSVDVATNRSAVFTGRAGGGVPGASDCCTNEFNRIAEGSTRGTITHDETFLFTFYAAASSRPFGDVNGTSPFAYGEFYVEEADAGTWYFKGVCDDRVMLIIDDEPVLVTTAASVAQTGSKELAAGWHTFRHHCFDATGAFGATSGQSLGYNTDGSSTYADFSVKNLKMRAASPAGGRNTVRYKYYAGSDGYDSAREHLWDLYCVTNSSAARVSGEINDFEGWFYVPAAQAGTWSFTPAALSAMQIDDTAIINWESSAGTATDVTLSAGWHRYWARYMGAEGTTTTVSIAGADAVTFGAENEDIWFSLCPDGWIQGTVTLGKDATLANTATTNAATVIGTVRAVSTGAKVSGAFTFDGGTIDFGTVALSTRDLSSVIAFEDVPDDYLADVGSIKIDFPAVPPCCSIRIAPAGGLTAESAAEKLMVTVNGEMYDGMTAEVENGVLRLTRGGLLLIVR